LTILGHEFAGQVEAIGGVVTSFKIGERVFGYRGSRFGAHAEYPGLARAYLEAHTAASDAGRVRRNGPEFGAVD
jgi:NADPH:quinone reductase-like Zn-dependent oxidoreductase